MRSDPARLSALLQLIPATDFPTILRTSLDASLFTHIVQAISLHLLPSHDASTLWHILSSLPTVPRFALTTGFLGVKDKQILSTAFTLVIAQLPQGVDEVAVRATAAKYRITAL